MKSDNLEKPVRSVRKVLVNSLGSACKDAEFLTGKSINSLPEFFLAVKVAEYINSHFPSYCFSMEESLIELCEEVGVDYEDVDSLFRIDKNTRADLVLKSRKYNTVKHIVEFKRSLHSSTQIEKDALRLAWICASAPPKHRIETNYLVAISHSSPELFEKRTEKIKALVNDEVSSNISIRFEPVDLSEFRSTRKNNAGRVLHGGVWEFKYKH